MTKPTLFLSRSNIAHVVNTEAPWHGIAEELKIILVREAMRQCNYNETKAALLIDLSRGTLRKILKTSVGKNYFELCCDGENIKAIVASNTPGLFKQTVKELRKVMADEVLTRFYGNQSRSTAKLGCNRTSLRQLLAEIQGGKK